MSRITALLTILLLMGLAPLALAADPGHPASSIGQGIFETGNFTFTGNFSVGGGGTLWAFLNNATGNLGLGTTLPTHKLQVEGNATVNGNFSVGGGGTLRLFVDNSSGNVGIGTTNPVSRLHVEGGNATINGNFTVGSPNNVTFFVNNASRTVGIGGLSNISRLTIAGGMLSDGGWTSSLRIAPFSGEDYPSIYFGSQNNTEYSAIIWSNNTAGAVRCDNCRLAQVALTPANDTSADLTFSTNPDAGRSAPAARMTIKSTGNVGIGTTSPSTPLHINAADGGATVNLITFGLGGAGSSSNVVSRFATFGGGANNRLASWTVNYDDLAGAKDVTTYGALAIQLGPGTDDTNNGLAFQTAAAGTATTSTAMFISQGGNVGIGTTGPGAKLHISGTGELMNISSSNYPVMQVNQTSVVFGESRSVGASGQDTLVTITNMSDPQRGYNLLDVRTTGVAGFTVTRTGRNVAGDYMNYTFLNGKVGIGTTSPATGLHINDGTNENLRIYGPGDSGSGMAIQSINDAGTGNTALELRGNPTYFSIGNVGIGTTGPSEKLDVVGNLNVTGRIYVDNNTGVGGFGKLIQSGSSSDASGSFLISANELGVVYLISRANGNDHGRISAHLVGGAYTTAYTVTLGDTGAADITHSVSIAGSNTHTVTYSMDDTTASEVLHSWAVYYMKIGET